MNDRTRQTVTKDYLEKLQSQRLTPDENHLTLDMQGPFGDAVRDSTQRNLEREIGRVEDQLYNQSPNMLEDYQQTVEPEFDNTSDMLSQYEEQARTQQEVWQEEDRQIEQRDALENKAVDDFNMTQMEQDLKEIEQPEPVPEIETPEPTPQYDNASEMLNQYEQAATPSNDTVQQNEPMEKSHDPGMGY